MMRYKSVVATGMLLSAAVFSSCTCHEQLEQPSPLSEPPSGFHAAQPKSTPQVHAQAPTATGKADMRERLAEARPTTIPPAGVPEDFPKDVPIFKDAALAQVQSLANNAHNVIFSTPGAVRDIYKFYQDSMTGQGWNVTQNFERQNHSFISFQKGNMIANVTIVEDVNNPGKQLIAIMYEEQKPLDFDEF